MFDAIVVGAGPVGSQVAYKLAAKGHEVAVLEEKDSIGTKACCTGIIGSECIKSLGIEDNIILRRINTARLYSPSGKYIHLQRRETQAYIVDRKTFDTALSERAEKQGAEYLLNCPVQSIGAEGDRVIVKALCQRRERIFEARAVVIASGFKPKLVSSLGLGRFADYVVGVQAEVETRGLDEIEIYFGQDIAPGFFAWLVPTLPGRALVGLLSRHNQGYYLRKLLTSLYLQGKSLSTDARLSYDVVPLKPLRKTYRERLLAIGDAAGQVKPTTAGGIYYGLLCADMAVNTLHRALETDDLSARSLAVYEQEWKRKMGRELKIGYCARKIYEHLNDSQIEKIFNIAQSTGIAEAFLKSDLSFDWHSEALLKIIGNAVMSKLLGVLKAPAAIDRQMVND